MGAEPLLSCVVPVYNVERHLAACVGSLMAQTYPNIEYIFVEDGSTDGSLALLRSLLAASERGRGATVIVNERNRGLAATRAAGIEAARGDYLMFCDSDDWIEPQMAADMMRTAVDGGRDIVVSAYYDSYPDRERLVPLPQAEGINLNDIPINTLYFSRWNKIVSAPLIKENGLHLFTGADCWEDVAILAPAYALAGKVALISKPYYHYRHQGGTLTAQKHALRLEQHLAVARYVEEWFVCNGYADRYAPFLKSLKFTSKIKMLRGDAVDVTRWKRTFPETNRGIMSYRHIPARYRLAFWLAARLPARLTQLAAGALKL